MSNLVPMVAPEPVEDAVPALAQADSDAQFVSVWTARQASPHTRRNYRCQVDRFLSFVQRPLTAV